MHTGDRAAVNSVGHRTNIHKNETLNNPKEGGGLPGTRWEWNVDKNG